MEVKLKSAAEKDLDRLPNKLAFRMYTALKALQGNPTPIHSQKLSGWENTYRLRVGDYRIIYFWDKENKTIFITKIKHRREVYR